MLKEKSDISNLNELLESLRQWSSKTGNYVDQLAYEKPTGSLYRFGWFYINGYKYSISGWKFDDGIVTFENEETGEKVKYNIVQMTVVGKKFKKDTLYTRWLKKIRILISIILRKISDKLHP